MQFSLAILSALAVSYAAGRLERRSSTLTPYAETVSVTVNRKPTQVTHTIQVAFQTGEAKDETIDVTGELSKSLNGYFSKCKAPASRRIKRTPPVDTTQHLKGPLKNIPACYGPIISALLKELAPSGDLFGVVTSIRDYVFEIPGHILNDPFVKQFQDAANAIPDLQGLPEVVRQKAVNTIVVAAGYFNEFGSIGGQFMVDNSLYLDDPPKEGDKEGCPWGPDTPLCTNQKCKGKFNSNLDVFSCVGGTWDGCRCYDVAKGQIWYDQADLDAITYGLDQINKIGAVGGGQSTDPRSCNPTSTNKWTSRDAAAEAAQVFCANNNNLSGGPGDVHQDRYSPGTPDELIIKVTWSSGASNSAITFDDCKKDLMSIIDGCDAVAKDNPANLKWGGKYEDPKGPTLEFAPVVGEPIDQCFRANDGTQGIDNSPLKYVTAAAVYDNINTFCDNQAGKHLTDKQSMRFNDKPDSIDTFDFTVESGLGYVVDEQACRSNLNDLAKGCDHPHSRGNDNPVDFKWGGIRGVGSVKWTIEPQKVRRIPIPQSHVARCLYREIPTLEPRKYEVSGTGWNSNGFDDIKKRVAKGVCQSGETKDEWWSYAPDPNADGWEWKGYFRAKTTEDCVPKVITDSGGDQVSCILQKGDDAEELKKRGPGDW